MKSYLRSNGRLVLRTKNTLRREKQALLMRKQELCLRKESATVREQKISYVQNDTETQFDINLQLKVANEHLVIASIESHILADKLESSRAEMSYLANYDFLTNLPNRMQLYDRISLAIMAAKRNASKFTILFLDLDRFKVVNDSFGHVVGDQLLQAVAQRLTSSVRASDTVSRTGGDEFVLLLPDTSHKDLLIAMIEKVHAIVSAPYTILGNDLDIGVTIGVSIFPEDGQDAKTLICCADTAMYHGKKKGRNNYQFFTSDMHGSEATQHGMAASLQQALELNQFVLFYQAQVNLENGSITGVEALIRWRHPERGLLLPESFINDAEACGAILEIGKWVLLEACQQAKVWLDAGLTFNIMAVNVSSHQITESHFLEHVQSALHQSGLEPNRLELELTETVLMTDIFNSKTTMQALRLMGIKLAIDDFGTGYSNLSYLKQFPVDTIKIDRSFVQDIGCNKDVILVQAIIGIGKGFQHQIVAEGIETAEQLNILRENDCPTGQGYYLNTPMVAEEFTEFLKSGISKNLMNRRAVPADSSS